MLDFLGLDHHHHHDAGLGHHDNVHLHRVDDVHLRDHSNVHYGHSASSAFLSNAEPLTTTHHHHHPQAVASGDSDAAWLAHSTGSSGLSLTARQAASFLDSGLTGISGSRASASSFLSVQERLMNAVQATPPAALVPLHALSIVGAIPGHVAFELGEGFLFGFEKGFALALAGKFVGSAAAFTIGRSALTCGCLRDRLKQQLEKWPLAKKVAKGVEKGGGGSVFVIRMAPVPCVVKNYSLAFLTEIPYSTYLLYSLAGLIPTTAAHVYAGTLAPSAVALARGGSHMSGVQAATLASPVVAGVLLTMFAGYYLHQHVLADEDEENEKEDEELALEMDKIKFK